MANDIQEPKKQQEKTEAASLDVKTESKRIKERSVSKAPVYSAQELALNPAALGRGCSPESITAAFKAIGKHEATIAEAKEIVTKFLSKEVK